MYGYETKLSRLFGDLDHQGQGQSGAEVVFQFRMGGAFHHGIHLLTYS